MNLPFSERTKSVMGLARGEAIHLQHGYLGTEHILLGILCESAGIAAEALKSSRITLNCVRSEVEELIGRGPDNETPERMGTTNKARNVIRYAEEEATQRGHPQVEPEHLLLGILREGHSVAANVLLNQNVSLESLQEQVSARLSRGDA